MPGLKSFILALALAFAGAARAAECVVAFDFGSSGIRAGTQAQEPPLRQDVDYFHALSETADFAPALPNATAAVRGLSGQGRPGFAGCLPVAGGFSVWRSAANRDRRALASLLGDLAQQSGVRLVVIPQAQEGRYAYVGSQALLGPKLQTSHVFDLGGGSLQVASGQDAFGIPFGQKSWHQLLCGRFRETRNCQLQALSDAELQAARQSAAELLAGLRRVFPAPVELTAISRPVTHAVVPAVLGIAGGEADGTLGLAALSRAIEVLAPKTAQQITTATGVPEKFADSLVSDMLLVEAVLRASGSAALHYADLDLTNVPGLLADQKLLHWGLHYACYLWRLEQGGEAAYLTDPATCDR